MFTGLIEEVGQVKQIAEKKDERRLTARDRCPDDTAWTLVVDDVTRPAFMQPPCMTRASLEEYKFKSTGPDGC